MKSMSAFGQQLTHVCFHTILSYQASAACMWLNQWTFSRPLLFSLPEGMCVITDPITLLLPTPQCFPSSQVMFKCFTMALTRPSLYVASANLPALPATIFSHSRCPSYPGLPSFRQCSTCLPSHHLLFPLPRLSPTPSNPLTPTSLWILGNPPLKLRLFPNPEKALLGLPVIKPQSHLYSSWIALITMVTDKVIFVCLYLKLEIVSLRKGEYHMLWAWVWVSQSCGGGGVKGKVWGLLWSREREGFDGGETPLWDLCPQAPRSIEKSIKKSQSEWIPSGNG